MEQQAIGVSWNGDKLSISTTHTYYNIVAVCDIISYIQDTSTSCMCEIINSTAALSSGAWVQISTHTCEGETLEIKLL